MQSFAHYLSLNLAGHLIFDVFVRLLRLNCRKKAKCHLLFIILVLIANPFHLCTGVQEVGGNSFLKYFEPVYYNPSDLKSDHRRLKRDLQSTKSRNDEHLNVHFHSHGRDFRLKLTSDPELFHPDAIIENSVGRIDYDTTKVLRGSLSDEPRSSVTGVLDSNGIFDGNILTDKGDLFYVESSARHPSTSISEKSQGIIYRLDNVQWPNADQEKPTCASHELHLNRKEQLFNLTGHGPVGLGHDDQFCSKNQQNCLSEPITAKNKNVVKSRRKRYSVDFRKKTCMLYLQADHLFYEKFGSEEATIDVMTRHVQRLNEVYRETDFDMDGRPDDVNFMIKRIKVHTHNHTREASYPYQGDFQVIKYLERFSEGDYDTFCLAYMFTFRDFEGGTLGLAWTGDLRNAGGVCERKGIYRGGIKSLNTGIITLLNYGKIVPLAVSHITLAHEIGHNFGSPHDPENDKICTPGGDGGNYIMFARATAGDKRNNNKFSPCSLKAILPVLNIKARDRFGCFSEPQKSICGNGVVEDGEICDCGWEEDCKESCCFPMAIRPLKNETPCTLKPRKICSPSQGPCCTLNCELKMTAEKCRDDNGCRDAAYCNGKMPQCPRSKSKPNKTICNKDSVCFMGECTGSICLAYGLDSCQCNNPYKYCDLCCKLPGDGQACLSSSEWNTDPYDVPDFFAKAGSPCKNYSGYCDAYQSCREVDPSGPLATLRKLLLADEGLATIAEWIDNHWYAVISFVVLIIVLMILAAKVCGKKAKDRLRKLTIMHSNVQSIQVQRDYIDENGVFVHPVAERKKIPLRKKIRERRRKKRKTRERPPTGNNPGSSNNPGVVAGNSVVTSPSRSNGSLGGLKITKNSIFKRKKDPSSANSNGHVVNVNGKSSKSAKKAKTESPKKSNLYTQEPKPSAPPPDSAEPLFLPSPLTPMSSTIINNQSNHQLNDLNKPGPSSASILNTSYTAPTSPNSSSQLNFSNSNSQNQNFVTHEPKIEIVPLAKRGKRKPRKKQTPTTPKSATINSKSKSKPKSSNLPVIGKNKPTTDQTGSSTSLNSKKNIQVIYTAPFSIKVQMVPAPSAEENNSKNLPSTSKTKTSAGAGSKPSKTEIKSPGEKTKRLYPELPKSGNDFEMSKTFQKPTKPSSNQTINPMSIGLKKSTKTNLAKKRKVNSELRVLIPKSNEDEELNSPGTPYT